MILWALIFVLILGYFYKRDSPVLDNVQLTTSQKDSMSTYTYSWVYLWIDELEIKFPQVVFAQVLHETKYLSSLIFLENNNLLGMKCSNSRPYCTGINRGHAMYSHPVNSLLDYKDWQATRLRDYESYYKIKVNTEEDYIFFLQNLILFTIDKKTGRKRPFKASYAEDKTYPKRIREYLRLLRQLSVIPQDTHTGLKLVRE